MGSKPKIFISYSWDDDFSSELCVSLEATLPKKGYQVWRDQSTTKEGQMWRPNINRWLGSCDGAIILFSKHALESEWIHFEASVLSWRKSLWPGLHLLPVLLDGVKDQDIRTGSFAALELGEIMPINKGKNESSEELAERIAKLFSDLSWKSGDCAMSQWIEDVAGFLEEAKAQHLKRAADKLEIGEECWTSFEDKHMTIAYQLLHADTKRTIEALYQVCNGMASEPFEDLKNHVKPNWVQHQAARRILSVPKKEQSDRQLAINAACTESGEWYIRRAMCCSPKQHIVETSGIGDITSILDAFDRAMHTLSNSKGDDEMLSEFLQYLQEIDVPVFVFIGERAIKREILDALRTKYPNVVLVLLSGDEFPDHSKLGLSTLECILPKLEQKEEKLGHTYVNVIDSIHKQA